jgi:hypothetical protein
VAGPALATASARAADAGTPTADVFPAHLDGTDVPQAEVVPAASIIPAAGALFGAFVKHDPDRDPGISEPETLERVTHELLGIDHSFQHWGAPFRADRLTGDIARGRTPLLSWGAGPQAVLAATAAGANDAAVRQQAVLRLRHPARQADDHRGVRRQRHRARGPAPQRRVAPGAGSTVT